MVYTLANNNMVAQTCTEAGKSVGSCIWSSTNFCYVQGGLCYCDAMCTIYNDCCDDVNAVTLLYGKFILILNQLKNLFHW